MVNFTITTHLSFICFTDYPVSFVNMSSYDPATFRYFTIQDLNNIRFTPPSDQIKNGIKLPTFTKRYSRSSFDLSSIKSHDDLVKYCQKTIDKLDLCELKRTAAEHDLSEIWGILFGHFTRTKIKIYKNANSSDETILQLEKMERYFFNRTRNMANQK